jgi:hypothetical protein
MNDFYYGDDEAQEQRAEGIHGDEEDYGACPECGEGGEMVAQGRRHWIVCHRDRVKWRVGTGLFDWFLKGRNDGWDRAGDWINDYREVAPDKTPSKSSTIEDEERLKRMFE